MANKMIPAPDVHKTCPQDLGRLMAPDCGQERLWQPEELEAIFRHQMSAPVQFDLAGIEPGLAAKLSSLTSAEGLLLRSFADLFAHPHPPVELLRMTKDFAKAAIECPDSPLPAEIGRFLYFGSIILARVRCGERVSELDDTAICQGLDWVLAQAWIDESTKGIFRDGRALLTTLQGQAP